MKISKKLPNQLTISRIMMIVIAVALANIDSSKINFVEIPQSVSDVCHILAFVLAVLAGLTDLLDGKIARKYHFESDFGRLMDPLADKVFVLSCFVMLIDCRIIPAWIVVVVITREFLITGLRQLALTDGVVIAADKSGKVKTFLQMVCLAIAGAGWIHLGGLDLINGKCFGLPMWNLWYGLLLVMTGVTLYSGISYCVKNYKLIAAKI